MDETIKTNSTIWTPAFISLFVINIFVQMGMYMMNSIVPKYASDMGAGPSVIGFVASLYGIASVLMTPINGPAFDAFSKRRILSLATGATGCVLVLYALAPSLSVVMVARFLHGVTACRRTSSPPASGSFPWPSAGPAPLPRASGWPWRNASAFGPPF